MVRKDSKRFVVSTNIGNARILICHCWKAFICSFIVFFITLVSIIATSWLKLRRSFEMTFWRKKTFGPFDRYCVRDTLQSIFLTFVQHSTRYFARRTNHIETHSDLSLQFERWAVQLNFLTRKTRAFSHFEIVPKWTGNWLHAVSLINNSGGCVIHPILWPNWFFFFCSIL